MLDLGSLSEDLESEQTRVDFGTESLEGDAVYLLLHSKSRKNSLNAHVFLSFFF